jgi:ABC-2 type transport system ATP-binding protein
MRQGQIIQQGLIRDLKPSHNRAYEIRTKADNEGFAKRLEAAGCSAKLNLDTLLVEVPSGETEALLWRAAAVSGHQIRYLRPQRSTLEEVFLKAVREQD